MKKIFFVICIFLSYNIVTAAAPEVKDSVRVYRLGQIEVKDSKIEESKLYKASTVKIPYYIIQNADVMSMSDLQMYIPGGNVRTNSRGESMLFIRGAGERQLGLFFDGVQMNVPWDNRLDLTFVPADITGSIRINESSNSIFYGANVLGGAVSISTVERSAPGFGLAVKLQAGDANSKNFSILHDGRVGDFNYVANISWMKTDGMLMSGDAPDSLGNQNNNSALRTNTDQERLNAYVRGEYKFDGTTLGLSCSYTTQEKGVAAETYAGTGARFWRYPERDRMILTFNGEQVFSDDLTLKGTFWFDKFSQQIDSYSGFDYSTISSFQNDDDNTIGTRLALAYRMSDLHRLALVLNGFNTKHEQSVDDGDVLEYTQNTISTGLEYNGSFSSLDINAGAGFDYNETPKTGLYTAMEGNSQSDFAGFLKLQYNIDENMAIAAGTSRRTRFPTMREQFDEALKKFIANPDLKPETGLLNDLSFIMALDGFSFKAGCFYNLYDDLIEKISAKGDTLKRKTRVNYSKATISGINANFSLTAIEDLLVEGWGTFMFMDAENSKGEDVKLVQKPEIVVGLLAAYSSEFGLKPQLELVFTGQQYDADPENSGEFLTLDAAAELNFRLGYSFEISDFALAEVFVRMNNITDTYRLSQWGLPTAGRTFYSGLTFRL